jgi:tetratricopeptide (TPR) repeat protein
MRSLFVGTIWAMFAASAGIGVNDLTAARNHQDLPTLDSQIAQLQKVAQSSPGSADTQYRAALAYSYAAEVAMEARDKKKSQTYAEAGMDFANKAVAGNSASAEYHRLLGALCGQVVPANPLLGALKYGQCARDELNKAIALDGKLAEAYVSRGVGNSYLPAQMGGGVDVAVKDFDKAISLDRNLADAYLWKGITLRKANRIPEARQALERAVQLAPDRIWAKQQLEKTPAH